MCNCDKQNGRKFNDGIDVSTQACTCCGITLPVVKLPAGGGAIFNCAPCLNPAFKERRKKKAARPMVHGFRFIQKEHIPESFWKAYDNDHTQIPNDHPSAQHQKAASRAQEDGE